MTPRIFDRDGPGSDFEEIIAVKDSASGLRAFIAIHSTARGPGTGGIRRRAYATEEEGFADALRLAEAMTLKCALAELPAGGAKTVILSHPGMDVPRAYERLGAAIENLGGRYLAGPDVGTGATEIARVRTRTRHVNPEGNDAGASTAAGVLAAMRGLFMGLDGTPAAAGRRVVVQGLGSVGFRVAEGLLEEGAEVIACDVDAAACERVHARGVRIVPVDEALSTRCDVFAPCALGGVLDHRAAAKIPARGICGSANNVLVDAAAGKALHARGVLLVPDFAASAGAVIEGVLTIRGGTGAAVRSEVASTIAAIEPRVRSILEEARKRDVPPERVATERAWALARS